MRVHIKVRKRGGWAVFFHVSVRLFADCCLIGADLESEPNRRLSVKRPNTGEENCPAPSSSSVLFKIQTILHKVGRQPVTYSTLHQRRNQGNPRTQPEHPRPIQIGQKQIHHTKPRKQKPARIRPRNHSQNPGHNIRENINAHINSHRIQNLMRMKAVPNRNTHLRAHRDRRIGIHTSTATTGDTPTPYRKL